MSHIRESKIENRKSANGGFTLIELLLVIGIILILIGILLPTVTQVRVAAQTANTRQMISRIDAGIASYLSDFQAYPGPFSNGQVGTAAGISAFTIDSTTGGTTNLTSTENMFLGLVGGLRVTSTAPLSYSAILTSTSLPTGPASLNTVNPKKHNTYLSVEPSETTALVAPRFFQSNTKGLGGSTDTIVPEILDKYSNPMPILYLRANRGNPGIVSADNTTQYNRSQLTPYGFPAAGDSTYTSAFGARSNSASQVILTAGDQAYFGNDATATTANGVNDDAPFRKDAYILISAGPDGKYGTNDDITNFRSN